MTEGSEQAARELRRSKAPLAKVTGELIGMSPWKKRLLAAFLLIAAIGALLRVPAWLDDRGQPAASTTPDIHASAEGGDGTATAPPPGARGFVDSSRQRTTTDGDDAGDPSADDGPAAPAETDVSADRSLPWTAHLGGWLAKLGLSVAAGLVLGVFFRAFLKTMAAITALVVTALVALSYFEVINVDFKTMRQNYDTYSGWLTEQGYRAKDLIVVVLPSFAAGAAGFFVGFVRK